MVARDLVQRATLALVCDHILSVMVVVGSSLSVLHIVMFVR